MISLFVKRGQMMLSLALLALIVGGALGPAQAQGTIQEIVVEGTERVDPTTILTYLTVEPGDVFDEERIDDSLKSLFRTGLFADVELRQQGGTLVVKVTENPIINRIAFEGNRRVDDEDLLAEIQLRPRVVYTRTRVQNDVTRIIEVYRRSGRFAATVEPAIIPLDQNRVDLVFQIEEGPLTEVQRVTFIGNQEFSDNILRDEIQTDEARWWRVLTSDDTYDPDRLEFDKELLRQFYLNQGFADFRVVSAVAELTPDGEDFFITFTVEEGDRYTFGEVEIVTQLPDLDVDSLYGLIESAPGDAYSATAVEETIERLSQAVGDQQYAFVDIRPLVRRDRAGRTINLTYEVGEGARTFVERISIVGNVRTIDSVIRREFLLVEGDPFNASNIQRTEERLRALNFFESVEVSALPGSTQDQTVIQVEVAEKSTGEVTIGAGFSSLDGFLGDLSIRERNLLGQGQDLRLSARLSLEVQEFDFSFTEPYFLDRDLAATATLFSTSRDNQSESSFDLFNAGGGLRFGFPLSEYWRGSVGYELSYETVRNVSSSGSPVIRAAAGNYYTSSINTTLTFDRLDSRLNPTEGVLVSSNASFAGVGGDVRYARGSIRASAYTPVPLVEDIIVSARGTIGVISGVGQDVRLNDRFFAGGGLIRGFGASGIGPRDTTSQNGDALGGNELIAGTVEASFLLGLPEELGLRGRVFTDAASLAGIDNNFGIDAHDGHALRLSVGGGLTWSSPFGPVSLDLAFPLIKEEFDQVERFRFSFGTSF